MEEPKILSPWDRIDENEIAQIFNISVRQAKELFRHPSFPTIKIGKCLYILPRSVFESFLSDPKNIIEFKQKCKQKTTAERLDTEAVAE